MKNKISKENNHMFGKKRPDNILRNKLNSGKTYEEIYGKEKAERIKGDISKKLLGTKWSEEHKLKMIKIGKLDKKGENNPMYGKRHSEETKEKISKKMSGENSPFWIGGKSFEPYTSEFSNKLKNEIRKRDNQVCMNCGIHREKIDRALQVHHVNYDKKLSIPENLISLCVSCHGLTNINRKYWTKIFQEKLNKMYNYKYSEENKIILNVI